MNNPEINEITPAAKASFKSRVVVAIILIALVVPCLFIGGWVYFAAIAVFGVLATYEMIHAPQKKYPAYIHVITYVIVVCYICWFVFKDNLTVFAADKTNFPGFSLEAYFYGLDISPLAIAMSIFLYCFSAILDKRFSWDDVAYFFTFTLLLGIGFQAALFCRYYPSYLFGTSTLFNQETWYLGTTGEAMVTDSSFRYLSSSSLLFFVVIGTTFNDTFAYFIGTLFGKHKMNERVSPHKTWEGFFGGLLFGVIACLAFGLGLALGNCPILPTLTIHQWYWIVLLSFVVPLAADLGDLSFSLIKRRCGIKDYSSILKGHGGIVDRVGSDMFSCIATAIVAVLITAVWGLI